MIEDNKNKAQTKTEILLFSLKVNRAIKCEKVRYADFKVHS